MAADHVQGDSSEPSPSGWLCNVGDASSFTLRLLCIVYWGEEFLHFSAVPNQIRYILIHIVNRWTRSLGNKSLLWEKADLSLLLTSWVPLGIYL